MEIIPSAIPEKVAGLGHSLLNLEVKAVYRGIIERTNKLHNT
jgi:hypothetical protein